MSKIKRSQSEVIRSNAALLLKQIGAYHNNLPVGDLRSVVKGLVVEAEAFVVKINEALPSAMLDEE